MKVDMSAEAVTARLKLASQLRRLCLALGKALPVESAVVQPALADTPSSYDLSRESTDERHQRETASLKVQSKE